MKIFNLLNEYTSDTGSWSIEYNNHKLTYSEPDEYYTSHDEDDSDELDGINTKQDIYRLYWFDDTPIGHYCILANSIEELEEKIIDVIREERLTKYKTEEVKPKTDLNISCKYKIQIENKSQIGNPHIKVSFSFFSIHTSVLSHCLKYILRNPFPLDFFPGKIKMSLQTVHRFYPEVIQFICISDNLTVEKGPWVLNFWKTIQRVKSNGLSDDIIIISG